MEWLVVPLLFWRCRAIEEEGPVVSWYYRNSMCRFSVDARQKVSLFNLSTSFSTCPRVHSEICSEA